MERESGRWMKPLTALSRYKYVLVVAALGALLLAWPQRAGERTAAEATEEESGTREDLAATEAALEEILEAISGVGEAEVMLTLQSGGEKVLASDSTLRYSGSAQAPDDYERAAETVLISGGGEDDVVVTEERCPQYRGALVVCEGGGSDAVRLRVTEAVAALTGLGADRIAVAQGGGTGTN